MRILIVHNRYQQPGGEDAVVAAEAALLEGRGHTVARLVFDNRAIPARPSPVAAAQLAVGTTWSRHGARAVRQAIRQHRPDIVHLHNTFPLISPAACYAARAEGVPVVQTLHNFRPICPAATLYRAGAVCEDCLGRVFPWPGVAHRCYRGSSAQTTAVAAMIGLHRLLGTWRYRVDRYIALSQVARDRFIAAGFPPERIVIKPNFVAPDPGERRAPGSFFLFVGRLTVEKGVETLLRAWIEHGRQEPLHIVGDGPLAPQVAAAARVSPAIRYLGRLERPEVLEQMRQARALIFPSVWYECFPVTLVEALACGLPVIASRLGAAAEIIEDGVTGLHVTPGSAPDLVAQVARLAHDAATAVALGRAARRVYEATYTADANYDRLLAIYREAQASARARHG
ncbi:MAG: glycosyltransferase family 4 protein [Sphaerobacter sp.]|nr:glycosyltransferase family 4 protein [Sphaerobacter sp.]